MNTVDTKVKLHKPVEALVMVLRTNKLSVLGRKMYNVLLFLSQTNLKAMSGMPSATHLFESSLTDVLKMANADGQHKLAKQYLGEMRRSEVEWESPDANSELQSVSFSLLSETRFSLRSGKTWVQWALPPTLYEALIDPQRWATIDLSILSNLSSYTAVALYEICTRYRNNPSGVTSKNDPVWWVDALSSSPAMVDPKTGKRKRREWRKVKNEFVLSAIQEINEKTDLTIELIENKEGGRTVISVQFSVRKKNRQPQDHTKARHTNNEIVMFANRLGVTSDQELNTMANEHGEDTLFSSLQKLEHRQQQTKLPVVKSPAGYLRHILADIKPEPVAKKPMFPIAEEPVFEKPWLTSRREEIFNEIMSMSIEVQKDWIQKCITELKATGNSSSSIERRAARDDWAVGVLKSLVGDFYAAAVYGPDWATPPLNK